jgi:hypothetical protein
VKDVKESSSENPRDMQKKDLCKYRAILAAFKQTSNKDITFCKVTTAHGFTAFNNWRNGITRCELIQLNNTKKTPLKYESCICRKPI